MFKHVVTTALLAAAFPSFASFDVVASDGMNISSPSSIVSFTSQSCNSGQCGPIFGTIDIQDSGLSEAIFEIAPGQTGTVGQIFLTVSIFSTATGQQLSISKSTVVTGISFTDLTSGASLAPASSQVIKESGNIYANTFLEPRATGTVALKISFDSTPGKYLVESDDSSCASVLCMPVKEKSIFATYQLQVSPIPEPGSVAMLISGLAVASALSFRRSARRTTPEQRH